MKIRILCLIGFTALACLSFSQENEIPESGSVGIGTTNPTEKLDVRGGARIDSTLNVGDSLIIRSSARVGDDLRVSGNALIEKNLRVLENTLLNNTQIGGAFNLPNLTNATQSDYVLVTDINGIVQKIDILSIGLLPYKPLSICSAISLNPTWSSGPNKIYSFCPDVKVGIATSTPLYNLDVRGTGYFSTGLQLGDVPEGSSNVPALIEGERTDAADAPLLRLSIKQENGTSQTRFKVEKDGRLYCTSVYVRPTMAIPDYVFRPGYQLMPLNEVKSYVEKNSHLPNIPCEAEINSNGLNLDEMQLKLLEKVEELTLYVIDLNEVNKAQDIENAKLRAEMEALKSQIVKE